ncbi:transposase [Streptomyces pseudovenezuelae]|uniref:Transposase n=1 Tax=Streptomyces pseudovenezuelae TaxID=67350 RepID=A0ABT6LA21_9ACTN|nr:transposase [Streptomyces pseudovenezuelae]
MSTSSDRLALHTGIQWEYLPQDLGFGSGMTCWRQLRNWNEAGVWQRLHEILLAELNAASRLAWSRCEVDSSHVRALKGGQHTWNYKRVKAVPTRSLCAV